MHTALRVAHQSIIIYAETRGEREVHILAAQVDIPFERSQKYHKYNHKSTKFDDSSLE